MSLQVIIENAFEHRHQISPATMDEKTKQAIHEVIQGLDTGAFRVAEPPHWQVNDWIKKAVLLSFRMAPNQLHTDSITHFFDKVPLKFSPYSAADFEALNMRVVPPAYARKGAFIGKHTILMPSYVNIGAYVDDHTLVDTWATVGSCAQIGKHVHLSGGVGIGGVLEPLQATPTIIEDHCFIGARSEIVEGVIVERGSVISMGVYIGQSTKIYNRETKEITYGRIPAGSVVVPGNLPADDGSHSLYCAVIVKQVDAATLSKTELNQLLRNT